MWSLGSAVGKLAGAYSSCKLETMFTSCHGHVRPKVGIQYGKCNLKLHTKALGRWGVISDQSPPFAMWPKPRSGMNNSGSGGIKAGFRQSVHFCIKIGVNVCTYLKVNRNDLYFPGLTQNCLKILFTWNPILNLASLNSKITLRIDGDWFKWQILSFVLKRKYPKKEGNSLGSFLALMK